MKELPDKLSFAFRAEALYMTLKSVKNQITMVLDIEWHRPIL